MMMKFSKTKKRFSENIVKKFLDFLLRLFKDIKIRNSHHHHHLYHHHYHRRHRRERERCENKTKKVISKG